jgi:MoaA/NifB/PqqE/SkfB family radical SAM enzyme
MARSDPGRIRRLFQPPWDWIQVEITTHCNAACTYCPRTVYQDSWQDRHLPLEMFKKLVPAFSRTRHVHLQGWGEPLLHPDFFDMVSVAKASECRVGTTTNGTLLTIEKTKRLIESGLDVIAFSLAGTRENNDLIRQGTNLKRVLEGIRRLHEQKKEKGSSTPEIHIAYMLFRSGMRELELLPALLEGLGVNQVVVSTLDFVPTEELRKQSLIPTTKEEFQEICACLDHLVEAGRKKGLSVHYHLGFPEKRREVCTENVQNAFCVSSDGAITPCVYTNLRVSERYYDLQGKQVCYQRMVFGNIQEMDVADIWKQKSYRAFRRSFRKRQFAPTCQKCPKIR